MTASRRVVISQPMLFPWVGLLEQIRLADVFVHYDDVQLSTGAFVNRVQLKTHQGSRWLTLPLSDAHLGVAIRDARIAARPDFRKRHLAMLSQEYARAPFAADMLAIVRRVYALATDRLADLVIASMTELCEYFDLDAGLAARRSSELGVPGHGTDRVLAIVRELGGDVYITGHGARGYLDHEAFDEAGVRVEYLDYEKRPYPQLHGAFTPFVSALDLVANLGREGKAVIRSGTVAWKEFLSR